MSWKECNLEDERLRFVARLLDGEVVLPSAEEVEATARSLESAGYPVARDGAVVTVPDPWGTGLRVRAE